ncbi:hypothetical protein CPB84DRAFT_274334 [Gymnopilus junonius]|uniref:Uncharacterized protein n=1 Tax=Gymnopilus junonius TaxID=109634 RepID=A0A9P5TQN0_GYMJU|nr:hypothetical protein CPB84DRAFT_274334 [Gymnopilus junonius]
MSRTGLVPLFFVFAFIGLVACAPLPGHLSSLVERYDNYKEDLPSRSLSVNFQREYDDAAPAFYAKRDFPFFLKSRDFELGHGNQYSKRASYNLFERDYDQEKYDSFRKRAELDSPALSLSKRNIFSKIRNAFHKAFHKVSQTFHKAASAIKSIAHKAQQSFRRVGNTMRGGFVNMGNKMNKGFQKVGQAAKKVGKFFKDNGLKIAKVGLKFIAAGATAAGKIIKFIPGVGTAVGIALKGIAMGANIGSDHIHANLGGTLGKITNGLDYVISPIGQYGDDYDIDVMQFSGDVN